MSRFHVIIAVVLTALSLAACDKENGFSEDGAFRYDGVVYNSLQEAVDASLAGGAGGYITLLHDARGNGASVVAAEDRDLLIDFAGFHYYIIDGYSLCTGASNTVLKGNGGGLTAGGTVLTSDSGSLVIDGDLDIAGDIHTSSYTSFTEDYSGTFKGDIVLDGEEMYICSGKGSYDIPVLEVKGEDAFLQVCIYSLSSPTAGIRIGDVVSSLPHPVMADGDGGIEIASGAKVHIHNYSFTNTPATCTHPARIEKTCRECGYSDTKCPDETYGDCPESLLFYVPAVEATATQNGMKAHWECPFCGRCYTDKEGHDELVGSPVILAGNYIQQASLYSAKLGGAMAITGLVLAIAGLVETLGLSIWGIVAGDCDEEWNEVNSKLDTIQASLAVIEGKIDELLRKIEIVPYKNLIISRNSKLDFLNSKSLVVFELMTEYINDKTMDDDLKAEKLTNLVLDWSRNVFEGTQITDLTQNLMQQYVNTGIEANVPQMFEAVANCSYLWEHDGYGFRSEALLRDFMLNAISYMLGCCYISSVKEYNDEKLREKELEFFKDCFMKYKDTVTAEIDRMDSRDKTIRRYNPDGITFNRYAKHVDFRQWFSQNRGYGFPRENQNGQAVASCNKVLDDLGLNGKMGMDHTLAKTLYSYYNRNNSTPTSIYRILRDSVGFYNVPAGFDPGILFVNKKDGFKNIDDDSALPTYKIFHWEVYRSHTDQDQFGIWTSLNDRCGMENHNFLYYCSISSYEEGTIKALGQSTRWDWWTLVTAE